MIEKTDGSFAAQVFTLLLIITHCTESQLDPATTRHQAAAASILSFGWLMDPGTRKLTTDCIWCCLLQYYQGASYFKQASDKTTVNCDVTFIPSSLCFSSDWLRAAVSQLHSWFGLCGGYTDGRWISPIETSWLIQDTLGRAGLERWSGECEMFAKFKSISSPLHPPAPGPSFTSGPHYANWVQIPATASIVLLLLREWLVGRHSEWSSVS